MVVASLAHAVVFLFFQALGLLRIPPLCSNVFPLFNSLLFATFTSLDQVYTNLCIGAIPLRSAMKYKGPYAPSGLRTTRSVQINPIESLGSTHTAKEYDRSYTGLGYSASLAQRRQKEQSKTKLPPLRFRY